MDLPFLEISWAWTVFSMIVVGVLYLCFVPDSPPFWEKQGVPSIPKKSLLGTLIMAIGTRDVHRIDVERRQKYGKIYGVQEGSLDMLTISDLDLLRDILVKDFLNFSDRTVVPADDPIFDSMLTGLNGDAWKRVRSIISPTFSTGKIKRMTDIIVGSAKVVVQNLLSQNGRPVNAKEYFNTFTMDVIASVAFAAKIHSYQDPNNKFLRQARKLFRSSFSWRFALFMLFPKLMKFLRISIFDTSITKFFKKVTLEIIEDRKKTGKVGNDFLQLMIDCAKEVEHEKLMKQLSGIEDETNFDELNIDQSEKEDSQIFKMTKETKTLTHDELIAQCVMFFLVGYATTAATLTLTAYCLAVNPEIQEKLRDDVDAVVLEHDGKLTYEGVQSMKYLDKVVFEVLRMYPAAIRIARLAAEDYKLGDTGYVVEKGKMVAIPIYAIHHNPEIYPDPEKFDPERFTAEEKGKRHPYAFLAFGAGPRNCVGMRFALMEAKLCVAYMVSQLTIKRCSETKVPPEIFSGLGLLEPKNIMLSFVERENKVLDSSRGKQD